MIPSKKVRILIVVILLSFGVWFLWDYLTSIKQKQPGDTTSGINSLNLQNEADMDGDGLYDWQENLYNTNIRIQDTDGDGVNDGEEVKNGHDPAVYGEGVNFEIDEAKDQFGDFVFSPLLPVRQDDREDIEDTPTPVAGVYEKYAPILNSMANVITTYPVIEASDNETFTILFTPGKSIDAQATRYAKVVENHRLVAASLEGLSNKQGLELEIIRLTQGYKRVADSLEKLVIAYPLYSQNETAYVDAVIEYSNAVVSLQRQLYTVTEFIYAKGIRLKAGDKGLLFLFGG